jgi:hypothetical protein
MNDDDRQQGLRGRIRPGRPQPARRVGEPNVLTGAAVPNQLSGQTGQPANVTTGTRPGAPRAQPVPVQASAAPATPARDRVIPQGETPAGGRQLPAIPTLIFLGFVGLTAFRMLGQFLESAGPDPTLAPGATAAAPGPVRFGTEPNDDCSVSGEAATFPAGEDVWWSAELATRQDAKATVVVIVLRDGSELEREVVPPDDSGTDWSVLCSGAPVSDAEGGTYRVEVWSEDVTVLHAAGEYTVAPGSG